MTKSTARPPFPIFLDFDGVVHPSNKGTFSKAAHLEELTRQHPEVVFIVSSDWRISMTLKELQSYFPDTVAQKIIDQTPDTDNRLSREEEILQYCKENGIHRFIALDDDLRNFPNDPAWLHQVEKRSGLTEYDILEISTMIKTIKSESASHYISRSH